MFMHKPVLLLLVVLNLILAACGSSSSGGGGEGVPASADDGAARGKALYEQMVIGSNSSPGCITCHSLEPGLILAGPSHAGLATRATETIKNTNYTGNARTVEAYLWESIVDPDLYVEKGFPPRVMYQNYGKDLSEQEISDIVVFMLTLK